MSKKKKPHKNAEIRAEQSLLHHELFHSGKYRTKVEKNKKSYRRKEKYKKGHDRLDQGLFYCLIQPTTSCYLS